MTPLYNYIESMIISGKTLDIEASDICNNDNGNYLIHRAVITKDKAALKLLLENGANSSVRNNNGDTALHIAAKNGDFDIFKLLIVNSDMEIKNNQGFSSIYNGFESNNNRLIKHIIQKMYEEKKLNDTNIRDETILHFFVKKNNAPIVKFIKNIEKSVKINIPDKEGIYPIHSAILNGNYAIINEVITTKNIIFKDSKDNNVLHYFFKSEICDNNKKIFDLIATTLISGGNYDKLKIMLTEVNNNGEMPLALCKDKEKLQELCKDKFALKIIFENYINTTKNLGLSN